MSIKGKLFLFTLLVVSLIFLANSRMNSLIDNFIERLENDGYKVDYSSMDKSFLFYKNSITLNNFYLEVGGGAQNSKNDNAQNSENLNEKNSNLKIMKLVFHLNPFSIFSGGYNSVDLINPNINFYHAKGNNVDDLRKLSKSLKGKFNIVSGDLFSYNKDYIVEKVYNDINGSLELDNSTKIALDLHNGNDLFRIDGEISGKFLAGDSYDVNIKILTALENLSYVGLVEFNDKKLQKISGKISGDGVDFSRISRLLLSGDVSGMDSKIANSNAKFALSANMDYRDDLLKISDIKYEDENGSVDGVMSYTKLTNKLDINFNATQAKVLDFDGDLNLFALKNRALSGKSNKFVNFFSYFSLLDSFNYDLSVSVKKLVLFKDDYIGGLDLLISSQDKKTVIKKLNGKLNDKYNITTLGEILNNGIRNHLRMRVVIPFDKKNEKFDVVLNYLNGNLTFSNINIARNDFKMVGKLNLSLNDEVNFVSGDLTCSNYNLDNFFKKLQSFIENKESEENNGVLMNILLLDNKLKFDSDLRVGLKNSLLNGSRIESLLFLLKGDDKRISISGDFKDKDIFDLNNRLDLFFDDLKPKIVINVNGNSFKLKNFLKLLNVEEGFFKNYFLFSDDELRKNTDKTVWRDVKINFEKFLDVNFDFHSRISDLTYGNIKIDEIFCTAISKFNVVNITQCSSKIEYGKIDFQGKLNMDNNSLASSIAINSINFNNFLEKKRQKPTFMSSNGKFFASGDDVRSFMRNSVGRFEYLMHDYYIDNLDLNFFVNNVHSVADYSALVSLAERSVVSGQTILNDVNGSLEINNGLFTTNFQFSNDRVTGASIFNASSQTSIFKGLMRVAFIPINYSSVVYMDLDWTGNMYNTNKIIDVEKLRGILNK